MPVSLSPAATKDYQPLFCLQMSMTAEYILKQSKLQIGVDSNLHLKSSLETSVMNGFQLQFCAEMSQLKDVYRFGYGVMMG